MINEEEKQDVGDIENNDEDFIAKMSDMTLKGEDQVGTWWKSFGMIKFY